MKENNISFNVVSQEFVNQSNEFVNSSEEELFLDKPAVTIEPQDFKCGKITPPIT